MRGLLLSGNSRAFALWSLPRRQTGVRRQIGAFLRNASAAFWPRDSDAAVKYVAYGGWMPTQLERAPLRTLPAPIPKVSVSKPRRCWSQSQYIQVR